MDNPMCLPQPLHNDEPPVKIERGVGDKPPRRDDEPPPKIERGLPKQPPASRKG